MRSKGKGLTASQKRWYNAVAGLGSVLSGGPAVLHHPIGQRGKHNKIDCGVDWIIPLTPDEHRALHAGDTFGFHSRKYLEKWGFATVSLTLLDHPDRPAHEVIEAIEDYHR